MGHLPEVAHNVTQQCNTKALMNEMIPSRVEWSIQGHEAAVKAAWSVPTSLFERVPPVDEDDSVSGGGSEGGRAFRTVWSEERCVAETAAIWLKIDNLRQFPPCVDDSQSPDMGGAAAGLQEDGQVTQEEDDQVNLPDEWF